MIVSCLHVLKLPCLFSVSIFFPPVLLIWACFSKNNKQNQCAFQRISDCKVRSEHSGSSGPNLLLKQVHPGASFTGLHADNSWISPVMEIPQLDTVIQITFQISFLEVWQDLSRIIIVIIIPLEVEKNVRISDFNKNFVFSV